VPVASAGPPSIPRQEVRPLGAAQAPRVPTLVPEQELGAPLASATDPGSPPAPDSPAPADSPEVLCVILERQLLLAENDEQRMRALRGLVELGMNGFEPALQDVVEELERPRCAFPGPPFRTATEDAGASGAQSDASGAAAPTSEPDAAEIERARCDEAWALLAPVRNSPSVHRFAREQIESAIVRDTFAGEDFGRYHELMARNGGYEAACLLLEQTCASSEELRRAAVGAIGLLADHSLVGDFLERVGDPRLDAGHRSAIVHALGEWQDPDVERRLCELVFDERVEAEVRGIVLDGLGQHWDAATLERSLRLFRALAEHGAEGAILRSKLMVAWTRVRPELVQEQGQELAGIAVEELTVTPTSNLLFRTITLLEVFESLRSGPVMAIVEQLALDGPSPAREQAAKLLSRIAPPVTDPPSVPGAVVPAGDSGH